MPCKPAVIAAATVMGMALPGCSSTATKPDTAKVSSAPAPSSSPKQEGPEEFVQTFLDAHNALARGNPRAWDAISATDCTYCREERKAFLDYYRRGGWVKKTWRANDVQYTPQKSKKQVVIIKLNLDPERVKYDESSAPEVMKPLPGQHFLGITKEEGSWKVSSLTFQGRQ